MLASSGQALLGMSALPTMQDCCPFCPQNLGHHVAYVGVPQTPAECHFIASRTVSLPSFCRSPWFLPQDKLICLLKTLTVQDRVPAAEWDKHGLSGPGPHSLLVSPPATHTQHMTELSPLPSSTAVLCTVFSAFCCAKHHWTAHCPAQTGVPTFHLCTPQLWVSHSHPWPISAKYCPHPGQSTSLANTSHRLALLPRRPAHTRAQ